MKPEPVLRFSSICIAALLVLAGAWQVSAQDVPVYVCQKTTQAPVIDGVGDDAAWAAAPVIRLVDVSSLSPREFERGTQVRMLWDDEALYVLFTAHDPDVWSTMATRDGALYNEEVVELFIDPDGDGRNYVEIEVNSLNTVFDLLVTRALRDGGQGLPEWSPASLRTAVGVVGTRNQPGDVDEAWVTEIALPWVALRSDLLDVPGDRSLPPRVDDSWRLNLYRYERSRSDAGVATRTIEYSAWSPVGRVDFHVPERFGVVRFAGAPATSVVSRSWAPVKAAGGR